MKVLILTISLMALMSCTKDWECCIESHHVNASLGINTTSTNCIDWRGTNQEKNDFETDGTMTSSDYGGGTVDLITTCVPD